MLRASTDQSQRAQELHQLERAQYSSARLDWTNSSKSKLRARLSRRLVLPYLDSQVLAARKLQSVRLATKTSISPREPDHSTKTSPRSMGTSSHIFKSAPEQRSRAITDCLNKELEVLDVSQLRWTRDRLSLVGRCTNLIKCNVSGIGTTDSAIIALQSCLRLRHLNLGQSEVSSRTLAESLPAWRHLQELVLDSNPQLFDFPGHGSHFLQSKWEQYSGVGARALKNLYIFLHHVRVLSVTDAKTLKKIYRKTEGREYKFEQVVLTGMLNGNARMLFGQFAVHGGEIVTQEEVRGLSNLLGLGEGIEKDFPMTFDLFARNLALCLKSDGCSEALDGIDWEKFAWRTVGITSPVSNQKNDTECAALGAQIPIDQGALLLRSISKCRSLRKLSLSCLKIRDFSLGGFLPPPTAASHNPIHVSKWHEYNAWVQTGRWTSVKLTEKDHADINRCRNRMKELREKIIEFKERLKIVSVEMKVCEKNIAEHGQTKRLKKELEKSEKRFKNIQQRIIESKAKIEELEDDVSNMGSIVDGEIRPIPGPRLLIETMNLTGSCLSDEGIAYIAARTPWVTTFRICCVDEEDRLTNTVGKIMIRAWKKMFSLDFSGCSWVGDPLLLLVTGKFQGLTKLSLGRCSVTVIGTNAIAENCDALQDLDLTGCVVSETTLNNILRGNPNLKMCRLDFVDVADDFLTILRKKYRNVTILSRIKKPFEKPPIRMWQEKEGGKKGKKKKGKKKQKKKKKK